MRVIFMGSPDYALPSLDQLLSSPHQVVAVVTQPDRPKGRGQQMAFTPVKERALAKGIPVLQPQKINEGGFIAQLKDLAPDVLVVVAYGQLLNEALLTMPPKGCINVHASLLPKYRGAAPIHWSIIQGEGETGVTTMLMDRGMDTGAMLLKKKVPIEKQDTVGSLHDKLAETGGELLMETLALLENDQIRPVPQSHEEASYASLLGREHEQIIWQKNAREVHNQVRGLNPWPGAYTLFGGKTIKIWETQVEDEGVQERPGLVLDIRNGQGILVACGRGSLWLRLLQPQGKRPMPGEDWARGVRLEKGSVLG
ncbi:methionyl-tRNA formyltransferase [Dehalobacterium formicoaceticum]|uniref:Methionyl-tRNA formyltransferase n=1 Tax=Dehalobacterium formicoaceticum TaxID=51515 RepID=A0ABT1Y1A1_9FIRM|nr:methionyl-tRNA formyltransferase [Dehalobacterium formicoaceticum]MCR6544638.1 methionyl-tRNA formyltransferase [Dehalobacterium formicoaceticum]